MTQQKMILNHLKETPKHSITSMEAFQLYGATRLSAVIFILRKRGYDIVTIDKEGTNRFGEHVRYGEYILREDKNEG